ncbi:MAG: nickel ABC transporter substrate-binding protein, partial [Spirochaetales bacterium]|nr:nickel ABC transporter substrate-binding protein [Spirochaetales bacterium]
MKRTLLWNTRFLSAALILSALLLSCRGGESRPTAENRDQLVYVHFQDIGDLNPHLYSGEMFAQNIIYDSLVQLTESGIEPSLAESWEISEDGLTYTFQLREGVLFSDGSELDAPLVKANIEAVLENKGIHSWLGSVDLISEIRTPADLVVQVELTESYYPFLTELSFIRPFAITSWAAMKDGSTHRGVNSYTGTGPYMLSDYMPHDYALFEMNPYYRGEKPAIESVLVRVMPDNQTRIMALQRGEVDLIYGKHMIDAETIQLFQGRDGFSVLSSSPTSTRHILMNTGHPILSDINVRLALQHAADVQTISQGIFTGMEPPAHTLYSPTIFQYDIPLKPFHHDKDLAGSLLDDAGWIPGSDGIRVKNGESLNLLLFYNQGRVTDRVIAEFLQGELRQIGMDIRIAGEEEQSYQDHLKTGDFDLVFNIAWGMPYDPLFSLSSMRQMTHGDYAAQLGLDDMELIHQGINRILSHPDDVVREELYKDVLGRLHTQALYLPLTYETNKAIHRSTLKGVSFKPDEYAIPF